MLGLQRSAYFSPYVEKWSNPDRRFQTSQNVVLNWDFLRGPCPWDRAGRFLNQIRNNVLQSRCLKMNCLDLDEDSEVRFDRRITALCWHPKYPYTFAVGSKFGDIVAGSVNPNRDDCEKAEFVPKRWETSVKGSGPGGSVTALLFDENVHSVLYRTSIDSTVARADMNTGREFVYYKFKNPYVDWFTAMDINFSRRLVLTGDTKGQLMMFGLGGEKSGGEHQVHKRSSKIHCIEFSKRSPDLFVTAGLEQGGEVKLWDIRKINLLKPLAVFPHNSAVNVAKFSRTDGSRLLTSDQKDEIRIYQLNDHFPESKEKMQPTIIKHHHKQFKHITPIKADWHPLADLIVIGNYPKSEGVDKKRIRSKIRRCVEIYSAEGPLVGEIYHPHDKLVSLNVFNPTGELLASGMSGELLIWVPQPERAVGIVNDEDEHSDGDEDVSGKLSTKDIPETTRGKTRRPNPAPRPRRKRELSPVSDDEGEATSTKKRSKKTSTGAKTATKTNSRKKK